MKPMVVKRIEINGYRGIDEVELTFDGWINIFVGRNNTGKSSILEAITLAASAPNQYYDLLNNDLLEILRERIGLGREKYLVNLKKSFARVAVSFDDDLRSETVIGPPERIQRADKEWIKDSVSILERLIAEKKQKMRELIEEKYREYIEARKPPDYLITRRLREKLREVEHDYKPIMNFITRLQDSLWFAIYTPEGVKRFTQGTASDLIFIGKGSLLPISSLYDMLIRRGLIPVIIDGLRKDIEYLVDLRRVENELMVFLNWLNEPLPLQLMGDGFREILRLALVVSIPRREHGLLILLEEPERHLHPGYIELVTDYIAKVANERRAQFFISTHSSEFIESLVDKATRVTRVFRMYREFDGKISCEQFTGFESKKLLTEIKEDLRGI